MGASGYRDHIVVCGWNQTARDLIDELRGDEYRAKIVVLAEADKNPAGEGVYFVQRRLDRRGRPRAGRHPRGDGGARSSRSIASNEADMHSILTIMAIESIAPERPHRRRGQQPGATSSTSGGREVDEILVTSRLASRLLARSALYPGLTELVTDIVSGGDGSELYRVTLPDDVPRAVDRRRQPPPPGRAPGDAAGGHPRRRGRSRTRRATS